MEQFKKDCKLKISPDINFIIIDEFTDMVGKKKLLSYWRGDASFEFKGSYTSTLENTRPSSFLEYF